MRKITLIAVFLFITHTTFSQTEPLRVRAEKVLEYSEKHAEEYNTNAPETSFAGMKLAALDEAKVSFTKGQETNLIILFVDQYHLLMVEFLNYKEYSDKTTTYNLWKALIDNEVDFRAILTDKQLKDYLAFANDHDKEEGYIFDMVFMSDKQLAEYKKEIE